MVCSHHETCWRCHANCLYIYFIEKMLGVWGWISCTALGTVGFDLEATIAWCRVAAADPILPLAARMKHEQMADWLTELRNLRTLL